MAFSVPSFPLAVDIYSGPWLTKVLRLSTTGNLALGRRGQTFPDFEDVGTPQVSTGPMYLLLPALTDVRDMNQNIAANDLVEVPSGSGRWYGVLLVDDVGKGFANEHRYAHIDKISERVNAGAFAGLFWPTPLP
jgi:hypothetical protein